MIHFSPGCLSLRVENETQLAGMASFLWIECQNIQPFTEWREVVSKVRMVFFYMLLSFFFALEIETAKSAFEFDRVRVVPSS